MCWMLAYSCSHSGLDSFLSASILSRLCCFCWSALVVYLSFLGRIFSAVCVFCDSDFLALNHSKMQRVVDSALGVAKESVKTFTHESINNVVRFINGFSTLLLSILPGRTTILEGIHGWELKPSFQAPRLPRWMEDGVSSFNEFIHDFSREFECSSDTENDSGVEDIEDNTIPSSPCRQASHLSRCSSLRSDKYQKSLYKRIFGWILWPLKWVWPLKVIVPQHSSHSSLTNSTKLNRSAFSVPTSKGSFMQMSGLASIRDHMVHRTTDRRRGLVEDVQLVIEVAIELVFDFVRKFMHCVLSPLETCKYQLQRLIFGKTRDEHQNIVGDAVDQQHSTLGDPYSGSDSQQIKFQPSLNTDSRTCEDVITELGYPYEAIRVTTEDGYVLLLERIPRRDSKKVLYLQHGLFDSSLGWVSNGVVGSQAFAAYDQGYDVFLGNLRGLVSREHIDKNISSQRYWSYSVNEHATQDIPSMIEKIHNIKVSELGHLKLDMELSDEKQYLPYTICAIAHSLGGAAMLMYIVAKGLQNIPHRLSRMILLSPAGFHDDVPRFFKVFELFFPTFAPMLAPLVPGIYIPTKFFRMIFNKLARDLHNYPAVGGLAQTLFSYFVGGDSSNWVGVIATSHYNMNDMPGVAYRVFVHLAQMRLARKFQMYDFGSADANREVYGTAHPTDIGGNYGVIDIPVDLVGGEKDKVIPASMARKHYQMMKDAGVDVSYEEFEYAHLDFTFSHKEELLAYVMSCLTQGSTSSKNASHNNDMKSKFSDNGLLDYYRQKREKKRARKRVSRKSSVQELSSTNQNMHEEQSQVSGCSSSSE